MDLNEQMAGEIARQLGLSGKGSVSHDTVRSLKEKAMRNCPGIFSVSRNSLRKIT